MIYNIHYDICALVVLTVVIGLSHTRKSTPVLQNRIFNALVWFTFTATLLDLASGITASYPHMFPAWVLWVNNCLYFAVLNFLPVIYCMYCVSLTDTFERLFKKHPGIFLSVLLIPYIIDIILIALTPIFKITFYIDSSNIYHRSGGLTVLYWIALYYIILGVMILVATRHAIPRQKLIAVFSNIVFSAAAIAVQGLFPDLLVQCFGISVSLLMIFFSIQKPEDTTDSITGLFNQTAFALMCSRQLKNKTPFTAVGIALDDMNFLNNTFGISFINELMHDIGAFISGLSKQISCFYLGQGKFFLMIYEQNTPFADDIIDQLRIRFEETWRNNGIDVKLFTRIVIVHCPQEADTAEAVADLLDLITENQVCREQCGNKRIIYAKNIDLFVLKRTEYIERTIKDCLSKNLLSVFFQPIYSIAEKRIIGAEALVRLQDEGKNYISPDEFIPLAEKNGYILRIGEFVFESVCRFISEIDIDAYGIKKIDINLSVVQCMQDTLADQLLSIIDLYRIPKHILNLEITETAAAYSREILLTNMQKLDREGIELSLDDYGSGYSNMNYMLSLPFKMIKIDKEIVWSAFRETRARVALSATISMIKTLGMIVLAEGVETKQQADVLEKLGCEYLQGYFYSEPKPRDAFLRLLKDSNPDLYIRQVLPRYILEQPVLAEELDAFEGFGSLEPLDE